MNKTALKNFATWSRRKLIEQVQTKALLYGIDEKNDLHIEEQFGQLLINGQTYPLSMKNAFTALKKQLEQKGYKQLLEEIAYTWFNRIIAIRYMEVHEYLPERVNVLSSSVGRVDPDILFEYDTMDLNIKVEEIRELVNAGNTEEAYRVLFVAQCNALNRILPFMFEPIQDFTELLLPDFLLDAESVIKILVQNVELTESFAEIEVIGWLYQYYNIELKDQVFSKLKSNKKIEKYSIPAATQLFTPKWIVQYMVENSLGSTLLKNYYNQDLKAELEYFSNNKNSDYNKNIIREKKVDITKISILDPCVGSGHMLTYAFDLLYKFYKIEGYPVREIPKLIIENNLYGLDIDSRAVQLSSFALMMKAFQYNRRIKDININIFHLNDIKINSNIMEILKNENIEQNLLFGLKDLSNIGSAIKLDENEYFKLEALTERYKNRQYTLEDFEIAEFVEDIASNLEALKILINKYDVVITNPPYLASKGMNIQLKNYVNKYYPNSKLDLYSVLIEKAFELTKNTGLISFVTQHSWMFLTTFEVFRENLISKYNITNMAHLGTRAFEDIGGEVVQTTAFVLEKNEGQSNGMYHRLIDFSSSEEKRKAYLLNDGYIYNCKDSLDIPGKVLLYWIPVNMLELLKGPKLSDIAESKKGLDTADNNRFLRYWYEVSKNKIAYNINDEKTESKKWYFLNKGGPYKKWYGNNLEVINWENNGAELKGFANSNIRNEKYYFKENITWSVISTGRTGFRYSPPGYIFSNSGNAVFSESHEQLIYLLGLLNSPVGMTFLNILSPSMGYESGYVGKIPYKQPTNSKEAVIDYIMKCIILAKENWDEKEVSIEYNAPVLLKYSKNNLIEDGYKRYKEDFECKFKDMKSYEKLIFDHFIHLYDLQEYFEGNNAEQILTLENLSEKDAAIQFLSYYVGVLLGRYDIGKDFSINLLSITENVNYNNDVYLKLEEFLEIMFGKETVNENINWLAESLGIKKGEDPEIRIRRYFLEEFFTDHCKMYQKRPIYWLVDSGKQKGLRTFIYMHRYQPDTMATIRFEHLQEIQAKYQQEIADLENRLVNPNLSAMDKKKLNAEKVSFEKKIDELREFDKRLAAIAAEEIEIDLDDGVKVNYEKFYRGGKGVLAKIK
ncbi:BREX-1 system adenine-specific DNA-methyltransferase PglX [Lysinibacillus sp. BNK-21]|uniref:BREX-1 system adenine-specific DNA-methyltransferase PglX n=1 Tax=Lysinibacillus sp. BNK-21 TaxID=3376156 RepID=UPI003B43369B